MSTSSPLASRPAYFVYGAIVIVVACHRLTSAFTTIFTVSPSQVARVKQYIEHQEEHHSEISFKEWHLEMLTRSGVEFD